MNNNFSKAGSSSRRSLIINIVLTAMLAVFPLIAYAHGGHKHVMGVVKSVNLDAITVKSGSQTVTFALSTHTRYYHGSGTKNPARATDVKDGMRVVVHLDGRAKAAEVHIP